MIPRAFEGKANWPLNSVKICGSVQKRSTGMMGSEQDAVEKFFRNLLGGCASSRFHRPPAGLGLGDLLFMPNGGASVGIDLDVGRYQIR